MGWTDISLCLRGPVVQDLRTHFTQRWNFIYDEKYGKKDTRYARLPDTKSGAVAPPQQRGFDGDDESARGFGGNENDGEEDGERGLFGRGEGGGGFRNKVFSRVSEGVHQLGERYDHHQGGYQQQSHAEHGSQLGSVDCQIARSVSKWSHNVSTEVS